MKKFVKLTFFSIFFILLFSYFSVVFGEEDLQIKLTPNTKNLTSADIILIIDVSTTKIFDTNSTQAVQVLVGTESENNKWVDLGAGNNGVALKKSYNYIVKQNGKISVRVVSWTKEDKSDLTQLKLETIEISNIDKTNPVIEKIDASISEKGIILNVIAKDSESEILKYNCSCEAISYNKVGESPKFEITNLEPNKEYDFVITVEDKIGHKTTKNQKLKTKEKQEATTTETQNQVGNEVSQNQTSNETIENENQIPENQNQQVVNQDNTIADKIIPEVGSTNILFVLFLVFLIFIIFILNKR